MLFLKVEHKIVYILFILSGLEMQNDAVHFNENVKVKWKLFSLNAVLFSSMFFQKQIN